MSAADKTASGRIAIKFGTSVSGAGKKPARFPPSSSLGKRPRLGGGHGLGSKSDSESESENLSSGRHEKITEFGAGGAILSQDERVGSDDGHQAKRGPLVIKRQPNRNWRAEARSRSRQDVPPAASQTTEVDVADSDKPIKWGLTITKSSSVTDDEKSGREEDDKGADSSGNATGGNGNNRDDVEKEAVRALMGDTTEERTGTRRVIARAANSEDDVFQRDFHEAPDASTLEDYEAMPVEEFGAALLRGMGWDGKDRGPKIKQVVRRPNQLGLGAKELKGAEDLGAWNHKSSSGNGAHHKQRPPRLHDYRREQDKRREKREERYRDSYKNERVREREERRGHDSSSGHRSSRHDR